MKNKSRIIFNVSQEDRKKLVALTKLYPDERITLSEAVRRAINIAYTHMQSVEAQFNK